MKKIIFFALLMLINTASADGLSTFVHPDTVPASSWSAKWIGTESAAVADVDLTGASWLWSAEEGINPVKKAKPGVVHFRKTMTLPANDPLVSARVIMSADNHFALSVNGQSVGAGDSWEHPHVMDITKQLKPGSNLITVRATNDPDEGAVNAAGLIGKIALLTAGQKTQSCVTDGSWEWSTDEKNWKPVHVIGAVGAAPWGKMNSAARAKQQNLWSCYRKDFTLAAKPKTARARIAVDSKYWLWVNGVMVVREGALKRGPTPTDTFFDEVDLAPHLKQGGNTVAILAWYFGKEGFSHKSSGKSGLLFEMIAGNDKIVSDASWRTIAHPSFGDTGAPHPNYRLPESNIRFDATKDVAGWEMPGFAATSWPQAQELGSPDCAPWNRLVKRPVPFWKDYGLKPYANASSLPKISDGKTIKAKIPYNAQITPAFKIKAKAGEVIKIQMDNYKGGSENNVRAEYVTRDGEQAFECYGWMNGHEVQYQIPAGVTILDLSYRETGFDTEFAGTFDCDDDFLNRLRTKAIRTLYITMRDNYMDCPDRERALWWGDAVNELGESFYAFDRRSDLLTRKCIIDLVAWQKPDGVLFAPIPAGNWDRDLPLQMLASIGRTGFWTYSFFSGDMETLKAVYPGMKRYMEIWAMKPDGLVVPRPGAWAWGDWGNNVDMGMLYNAWYHIGLQGLRNAAVVLKKESDLPWIDERMKSIEAAFNKTYWTGSEYRSPDYKGQTDDRANALAVVAGFAKPDQYAALIEVFKKQAHASPYMEKYVLEALCLMDQPELAQERMKKRYAKMVDHPEYTTLWEGWGIGSEGFGGGTINHAWSGGPLTIMSQYFAGIAPTAAGFASYSVLPQMGTLKKIDTKVVTAKGDIALKLSNTKERFTLELASPAGTQATVGIPVLAGETVTEVTVNGKGIWKAGKASGTISGVRFIEANARYLLFAVEPGTWSFDARKIASPVQATTIQPSASAVAPVTYPDKRPSAAWRMDALDQGVVLKHGDGPGKCDILGARDVWVYEANGTYYMHYDGAGPKGWLACLATSTNLVDWVKKGPVLDFGKPGEEDSASASYGVTYFDGTTWHMFYLGTPHVSPAPDLIPSFPYLTMKAQAKSPAGPWTKQPAVVPFRTKAGTYYSATASPGHIIKQGDEYLMFFSASTDRPCLRTLGIARTRDLNGPWTIDATPIVPLAEQVENSSLYFEPANQTWFLFTNHIGLEGHEYTDAVWVYWTKDLNKWNAANKAVVLDGRNCTWSRKCIGLPSVVQVGRRLAIVYDAPGGDSKSHMRRDVGLAWLALPLTVPQAHGQ